MDRPRILQRIVPGVCMVAVFAAVVLVGAATARADDKGTATAVVTSQLELLKRQAALNKCLAASPKKNTSCIRQKALSLATLAGQQVKLIKAAMDGTEKPCVRTVALQEIAYLQIWRAGALALYRNERKKARRIFLSSLKLETAQRQLQPTCLAGVLTGL